MTGKERLKTILQKETTCPICAGTGKDPVTRTVPDGPGKTKTIVSTCRRCKGNKKASRIHEVNGIEHAVICEEIGPNGELLTQLKEISLIADKHDEVLKAATGTITSRLNTMKETEGSVMQKAIDKWKAEGR